MRHATLRSIALLGVFGTLTACGSDSATGPKASSSLSAVEAQLVAANLFSEISRAQATAKVTASANGGGATTSAVPTTLNETVNSPCTAGGTITGTYTFTTDFNSVGTGLQSGSMNVKSNACMVSTGSRSIAVDGTFTLTFSVSYTSFKQSSNFAWNETGNFTWSGGSCAINYTVQLTPQGKETIAGSFCGQSITYSN